MSRRFVSSVGAALVAAIVSFPALAGQATKAPPKATTRAVPHTPWGDPDLQGVWNDATSTAGRRFRQTGAHRRGSRGLSAGARLQPDA